MTGGKDYQRILRLRARIELARERIAKHEATRAKALHMAVDDSGYWKGPFGPLYLGVRKMAGFMVKQEQRVIVEADAKILLLWARIHGVDLGQEP